jgi:hypothetical protein
MGCRGQVQIIGVCGDNKESSVYLYTHWGAEELPETVRNALSKGWRWDDADYLARIIFDEMIDSDQGMETGYGICCRQHGDIECLVTVNCNTQTVTVDNSMYGGELEETVTFSDYI